MFGRYKIVHVISPLKILRLYDHDLHHDIQTWISRCLNGDSAPAEDPQDAVPSHTAPPAVHQQFDRATNLLFEESVQRLTWNVRLRAPYELTTHSFRRPTSIGLLSVV